MTNSKTTHPNRWKCLIGTALLAFSATAWAQPQAPVVETGIDVLVADGFKLLAGQRVGLVTNPTGMTKDMRSTVDVLHAAPNVTLTALFGPEHGVRGDAHAGDHVTDARDTGTGVPIYSLYGKNRKPNAETLKDVDVLVFDIQDIGSRSYTFITTMAVVMDAAAEHKKRMIVLDRPNPLSGERLEGRPLDMDYRSSVGYFPIPYVHGMTVGELARMTNGEGWLEGGTPCDLTVVPMKGWKRRMTFADTHLPWAPTSPHLPRAESSYFYAATGIMGELHAINEGVGYPLPFELAGAPGIDAERMARLLNARALPGVHFRPCYYKPYYGTHKTEVCGGVQIHLLDPQRVHLTGIQFHIMDVAQREFGMELFGTKRSRMFDKVCGGDTFRKLLADRAPIADILGAWNSGVEDFRLQRKPYLLYD